MDIAEAIRSIRAFDLLVAFVLAAFFILGFMQGTVRRLLGLGSMLFAFLVAAQLREPLGDFLKVNWTHLFQPYSVMVGFGFVFVITTILATLLIQGFYKRVTIFEKHESVDETLGGLLGIVQGAFLLGVMIIILDSFFRLPGYPINPNELPLLREIHQALDESATASIYRGTLVPIFFAITGPFIPSDLAAFFPG